MPRKEHTQPITLERAPYNIMTQVQLQPDLAQALHKWVGSTYNDKISQSGGRADRLTQEKTSYGEIIDELYLVALGHSPSVQQRILLEKEMQKASSRREAVEGLIWALVSSREFAYNH